jgi:hypothetical protein
MKSRGPSNYPGGELSPRASVAVMAPVSGHVYRFEGVLFGFGRR